MIGYYFITDSRLSRAGNISDVKNAVAAGVKIIQYRDKQKSSRDMIREALILRGICRKVIFLINDSVEVALASGADGVHLGSEDLPYAWARKLLGKKKLIGITVHSVKEALQAERQGADYLGVSPIFSTKTKSDAGKPAGIGLISKIKRQVSIPIIAIGGIDFSNAPEVVRAGADGICAISAVVTKKDAKAQIKRFQKLF